MNEEKAILTEIEKPSEKEKQKTLTSFTEKDLSSIYDLYHMATDVHSSIDNVTRDFTLGNYTADVMNETFPKFVREQLKLISVMESYIVIPLHKLKQRYNDEKKAIIKHETLKIIGKRIRLYFLGELYSAIIMSRSMKGEVIKAILLHGKGPEEQQQYEENQQNRSMWEKLTSAGKNDKEAKIQ